MYQFSLLLLRDGRRADITLRRFPTSALPERKKLHGVGWEGSLFFFQRENRLRRFMIYISDSLSDTPHMFMHCTAQSILGVRLRPFVGVSEW